MPSIMPTAAGIHANVPSPSDSSIAGIMSDHTDAATITPAAKPRSALVTRGATLWRVINTAEAPITVPINGARIISNVDIRCCVLIN